MTRTLLCVGGPWDGKTYTARGDSFVLPSPEPLDILPAWHDTSSPNVPPTAITVHHHVYKRKPLGLDSRTAHGGEVRVRMEVWAYYGRDRQDRPEGFYL